MSLIDVQFGIYFADLQAMQVSVVINPKAGYVNLNMMKSQIQRSLFRCDLHFWTQTGINELQEFLITQLEAGTEAIVICGGDGTLNVCLQPLMKWAEDNHKELPPLCVIGSGTANDLASEIGVSRRVEKAVRDIFEGKIKKVDVIKISSNDQVKYMVTNGGFGMPALIAEKANVWRQVLASKTEKNSGSLLARALCRTAQTGFSLLRTQIYNLALVDTLGKWKSYDWKFLITSSQGQKIETSAPFVIVSNQSVLGGNFVSAPYTINDDGTFDLLLLESQCVRKTIKSLLQIRNSKEPRSDYRRLEVSSFEIESNKPMMFFGDGEILAKEITQCQVQCLPQYLSVFVSGRSK